jgi:hypothetical protein
MDSVAKEIGFKANPVKNKPSFVPNNPSVAATKPLDDDSVAKGEDSLANPAAPKASDATSAANCSDLVPVIAANKPLELRKEDSEMAQEGPRGAVAGQWNKRERRKPRPQPVSVIPAASCSGRCMCRPSAETARRLAGNLQHHCRLSRNDSDGNGRAGWLSPPIGRRGDE